MAAQPWYDYNITNPHSLDDGVDMGTPDNTPLSFPEPGQVIDASYHVYGGQVVVHMPDGYDEYWIHLNNVLVSPGEMIQPGQEIGTSGGGVGDLILKNGSVQPATSQSDYQGHSSGYHSELGLFQDSSAGGDMNQFNKGWGNKLRQLDPTGLINALAGSGGQSAGSVATITGAPLSDPWPPPGDHLDPNGVPIKADGTVDKGAWIRHNSKYGGWGFLNPGNWWGAIVPGPSNIIDSAIATMLQGLGFSSPANAVQRLGAGAVGIGVIFVGIVTLTHSDGQTNVIIQAAKSAAKAGVVAE